MFKRYISIISYFFLLACNTGLSYKILSVVPQFGGSHVRFMGKVSDILVKAGHEVTFLLIPVDPNLTMEGTKLAKIVKPQPDEELLRQNSNFMATSSVWENNLKMIFKIKESVDKIVKGFTLSCKNVINNDTLIEELRNEKFDLGITQHIDYCGFGLFKLLNIPAHVSLFAGGFMPTHYSKFGLTFPLAQMPDLFMDSTDLEMGFFNRIRNIFSFKMVCLYNDRIIEETEKIFNEKFGDNFVDIKQEIREASFHISNSDPVVDLAYPTLSKIVQIGGFSIPKPNKLNDEWEKIISKRSKNILISFGSIAKSSQMPEEFKRSFVEAINQFPDVTFIWKYEDPKDNFAENASNIHLSSWVPQTDLLNDKRLSGFMTHGGLNSLTESANYGMPLIVIPLFADQPRNAKIVEKIGFGKYLDKSRLSDPEAIKQAIQVLLEDDNVYKKNANRVKEMIKNRVYNQTDIFVKHIEYACKFKKLPHLNMEGHDISIFKYAFIDIILFFVAVSLIIISLIIFSIYKLFKCVKRKVLSKEKNE
uniref:UDP-glucuronosyltransferase n=1 Tax=Parastrongyloides trichosuri TaxID=131310 RepID=A0A0N4Z2L6_PARTI